MDSPAPLNWKSAIWHGLIRRCPLCGHRGIFESWFKQRDRCPTCNFPTTRVHDQWIGALGINIIVTFTLIVVYIVAGFVITHPDRPIFMLTSIGMVIAVVLPTWFYPISKSLWSGIDLAMRSPVPEDDVDPRYLPGSGLHE